MKTTLSLRKNRYLARVSIFLITAALIAGITGCNYTPPPSEDLEIRTWYDLDDVRNNLRGYHVLMNDLDSTTAGYQELASPAANGGKGWDPVGFIIGTGGPIFMGTFDGQGYEIRDLYINRPDEDNVGLFGAMEGVIRDVGAVNVTVIGGDGVGGLAGSAETVSNSYCLGSVTGNEYVGGLVGTGVTVTNSYSTGDVTGIDDVGGLMGYTAGNASNCYSTCTVTGVDKVGGLVGHNSGGTVSDSYFTGSVAGETEVGGLVGYNLGTVSDSYSTGSVAGEEEVGGLVGRNEHGSWLAEGLEGTVSNSHSTGRVTGDLLVGGLVGRNYGSVSNAYSTGSAAGDSLVGGLVGWNHASVSYSYSTATVTGNEYVGGLVGFNYPGTVGNSFWDIAASGQATSDGGTAKNTTEMKDIITFSDAGWNIIAVALNETNFSYIWNIVNNVTYPFLSWQAI